jgi:uridylate kinase
MFVRLWANTTFSLKEFRMSLKRVLVKISGEQLSGKHEFGIDTDVARYLAHECAKVVQAGCQLVLIVGGGNMVRGAELAGDGIKRVTADQMGMLSGLMNAMALTDIFEHEKVTTRCMSNIFAAQVAEAYSFRLAHKHLKRGRVIIVAGGIGRPFFTHDTAAVNIALELSCDVVLKATKVDGVYDKDPNEFSDAKLLNEVTFQQAVENPQIKVMDKAALGLAMEHEMPVIVFDPMQPDNIFKATQGESIGTKIYK